MNWSRVIGWAVLGAVVGAVMFDEGGFFAGALIGFLAARIHELGDRLQAVERRLVSAELRPAAQPGAQQLAPEPPGQALDSSRERTPPEPLAGSPADASTVRAAAAAAAVPMQARPAQQAAPQSQARATQPPHRPPQPPLEPSALAVGFARVLRFFTTGNVVAKVGVVVLFIGVAFLVNYAIENALLPPELRLAGAALLGAGLLGIGFRLRSRADAYGLLLQGAGIGVLYLTVFAAFRLYELLPASAAFVLLVVIVAASSLLAVKQNSEAMAALGLAGGFLAPILTSTGSGNHVALFSYYVLLNLGILGMAWFRSWRWVNLLGFVFTFGIGTFWGARDYQDQHFVSVEAFLIYFFLHYVAVSQIGRAHV